MLKKDGEFMLLGLGAGQKSYFGVKLFFCVYIMAVLFAALLTAPSRWLVEWVNNVSPSDLSAYLMRKKLYVYFNRLCYFFIIIGLPYIMGRLRLFSFANLGLKLEKDSLRVYGKCFLYGVLMAVSVFALQMIFCDVEFAHKSFGKVLGALAGAAASAFVVGILEETIFRCLIFRCFYTAFSTAAAVAFTSAFFAYKHFRVPHSIYKSIVGDTGFDTGFVIAYYDSFGIFYEFSAIIFASLFVFGAMLNIVYLRTKNLWAPAAIHSGIVFIMLSYNKLFTMKSEPSLFFGTFRMTDGFVSILIMAVFTALFLKFGRRDYGHSLK